MTSPELPAVPVPESLQQQNDKGKTKNDQQQEPKPEGEGTMTINSPENVECPCGNALVRDSVVVMSHWAGKVCSECEQAMFAKHATRQRCRECGGSPVVYGSAGLCDACAPREPVER